MTRRRIASTRPFQPRRCAQRRRAAYLICTPQPAAKPRCTIYRLGRKENGVWYYSADKGRFLESGRARRKTWLQLCVVLRHPFTQRRRLVGEGRRRDNAPAT